MKMYSMSDTLQVLGDCRWVRGVVSAGGAAVCGLPCRIGRGRALEEVTLSRDPMQVRE